MQSKYLGKTFNGWKVVDRTVVPQYPTCQGSHSIFTLKKKKGMSISTMTLSDREIRLVSNGKNIEDTIKGKSSFRTSKNLHREAQNTITKSVSLFNLFKRI